MTQIETRAEELAAERDHGHWVSQRYLYYPDPDSGYALPAASAPDCPFSSSSDEEDEESEPMLGGGWPPPYYDSSDEVIDDGEMSISLSLSDE